MIDGQRLAESITGLGYPSRHLSTTVVSDGEGGGQGRGGTGRARGEEMVSLEVSGVFRPACVAEVRGGTRESCECKRDWGMNVYNLGERGS